MRFVKPPPGMKGTSSCWDTGDVYFGIGSCVRVLKGVDSHDGVFGGWIKYVGVLELLLARVL